MGRGRRFCFVSQINSGFAFFSLQVFQSFYSNSSLKWLFPTSTNAAESVENKSPNSKWRRRECLTLKLPPSTFVLLELLQMALGSTHINSPESQNPSMAQLERASILSQVFRQSKNDDLYQEVYKIKNRILKINQEVGSSNIWVLSLKAMP